MILVWFYSKSKTLERLYLTRSHDIFTCFLVGDVQSFPFYKMFMRVSSHNICFQVYEPLAIFQQLSHPPSKDGKLKICGISMMYSFWLFFVFFFPNHGLMASAVFYVYAFLATATWVNLYLGICFPFSGIMLCLEEFINRIYFTQLILCMGYC